jgi:DNA-directed RNA polymerase specialized sigma24 family protein
MNDNDSEERATTGCGGQLSARPGDASSAQGEKTGAPAPPAGASVVTAARQRLAARQEQAEFGERDVGDVRQYVRGTVRRCFPSVVDPLEIEDLVQQGCLIVEEALREVSIGDSFRQGLAARLANGLYDYWRLQHPEVRRNTRAEQKAAARGEEYEPKVWAATGLAHEHGDLWSPQDPEPRADALAEVYDRLKIEELEGITSARELMRDPQKAGLLYGVASAHTLGTWHAEQAFEELQDLRLRHRPRTRFEHKPFSL